uniref:Uncharacterized protein n=1 Tax=Oryza brachyantha TaxID=4533 RepID=J3LQQ7_ORYBR
MDKKASPLAKISKHDMPNDLCKALTAPLKGLRVSAQLQNEAILPIHLPLPNAACTSKHACSAEQSYLKCTTERANRALGSMGTEPWGVAPDELAIAAGMHLAPTDSQLNVPHLRSHLPKDKAAWLGAASSIAVLDKAASNLKLGGHHAHLAHGVRVPDRPKKPLPTRGRQVLLQYVLCRRGLLYTAILRNNSTLANSKKKLTMFYSKQHS